MKIVAFDKIYNFVVQSFFSSPPASEYSRAATCVDVPIQPDESCFSFFFPAYDLPGS
jgi:hypothetical protein